MYKPLNKILKTNVNKGILISYISLIIFTTPQLFAVEKTNSANSKNLEVKSKNSRKPNSNNAITEAKLYFEKANDTFYDNFLIFEKDLNSFFFKLSLKTNEDKLNFITKLKSHTDKLESQKTQFYQLIDDLKNNEFDLTIKGHTLLVKFDTLEIINEFYKLNNISSNIEKKEYCDALIDINNKNFQYEFNTPGFLKDATTTYKAIEKVIKELCK